VCLDKLAVGGHVLNGELRTSDPPRYTHKNDILDRVWPVRSLRELFLMRRNIYTVILKFDLMKSWVRFSLRLGLRVRVVFLPVDITGVTKHHTVPKYWSFVYEKV